MDTDAFHSLPGSTIIDRFGYRECAPKTSEVSGAACAGTAKPSCRRSLRRSRHGKGPRS
jgi:hypothetical protein